MRRHTFIVMLCFAGTCVLVGIVYIVLGLRQELVDRVCQASQHDRKPLVKYLGTTVAEERLIKKLGLQPPAPDPRLAKIQAENFHALVELYQAQKAPFHPCER